MEEFIFLHTLYLSIYIEHTYILYSSHLERVYLQTPRWINMYDDLDY